MAEAMKTPKPFFLSKEKTGFLPFLAGVKILKLFVVKEK